MKPLKVMGSELFHIVNGARIDGPNPNMSGDCTGLQGDLDLIPQSARPCKIDDWAE